jgi:hypothetical protein
MMKDDESPDPMNVRCLCTPAVVPHAYGAPHLIEEPRTRPFRQRNGIGSLKGIGHHGSTSEHRASAAACTSGSERGLRYF